MRSICVNLWEKKEVKVVDIIVKSKIREAVNGLNIASEVAEALNEKVLKVLDEASERARANGRRTLQARDI